MKQSIFNKNISDGWYIAEAQEWIDYDGERIDIPFKIKSKLKSDKEFKGSSSVNFTLIHYKKYEQQLTNLLECLSVWRIINIYHPDPNTSLFDPQVIRHIKVKVPGMFCMVRIAHDDEGFCKIDAISRVDTSGKIYETY